MVLVCSILGIKTAENQGVYYKSLRPKVQDFLKTLNPDLAGDSFISYRSLNDLMRAYIANLTAEEIKDHQNLAQKIQERYETDVLLKPIMPDIEDQVPSFGNRLADKIADFGGSWKFIIIFVCILLIWMALNSIALQNKGFDPYPFILLNLVLSCIAALQAPVIMMSQNRTEEKDRARNEYDFKVNLKAETEIRLLHQKLDHMLLHQHKGTAELLQLQLDLMQQMQQQLDTLQISSDEGDNKELH